MHSLPPTLVSDDYKEKKKHHAGKRTIKSRDWKFDQLFTCTHDTMPSNIEEYLFTCCRSTLFSKLAGSVHIFQKDFYPAKLMKLMASNHVSIDNKSRDQAGHGNVPILWRKFCDIRVVYGRALLCDKVLNSPTIFII
ncbi:hypothetical protein CEXT_677471 [Caerostris extrusa]|uniref:Uncharacterized protein n=1 Tax=Caerostris extrusa TaxID=172846 RepID=A0AAV4S6S3_CAEEX|nr:hypothetical protein CEXT_677471 [Caerostris extrusa]